MNYTWGVPTSEPFSTSDAKAHLRVSTTDEDTLIDAYVASVRDQAEHYMGRATTLRTVTLWLNAEDIGSEIWLPMPPMASITSVKVYDSDNNPTTMAVGPNDNYQTHGTDPARIVPGDLGFYGSVDARSINTMQIVYTAGYGAAVDVPPGILAGLRIALGEMYHARTESEVGTVVGKFPVTAKALLAPYRYGHLTADL